MRPLDTVSLYPPRRDTPADGGNDHPDAQTFRARALQVMPELDAIAMATPAEGALQTIQFSVPEEWPDGSYVAYLEVNVEGDYNDHYDDETYPTPVSDRWDYWAQAYGYPYRGQPSLVFSVPFDLQGSGMYSTSVPAGYGALHGEDGELRDMDGTITDDPTGAPGSGADRLQMHAGGRFSVEVVATNVCDQPVPPPECEMGCGENNPCPSGFVCGSQARCVGMCDEPLKPPAVVGFQVDPEEDVSNSHRFANFQFTPPVFDRDIVGYRVRVSTTPITDQASFDQGVPARRAGLAEEGLDLCEGGCPEPGVPVTYSMGHLTPQTTHYIGIQAESCGRLGEIATDTVTTTAIYFTTVSPCFIATAAYGSSLADEVGVFRRFRDRHLMNHALGRALVGAYYQHGPRAARALESHPWLRDAARAFLTPIAAMLHDDSQ
jgi:hypothetical protein